MKNNKINTVVRISSPEIDAIFQMVCDHYHIKKDQVNSKLRFPPLKQARQVAHYVCRKALPSASLSMIGFVIGHKDHATVLNSCRRIDELIIPLSNGKIQDESLKSDIAILITKAKQILSEREFSNMGTLITYYNAN